MAIDVASLEDKIHIAYGKTVSDIYHPCLASTGYVGVPVLAVLVPLDRAGPQAVRAAGLEPRLQLQHRRPYHLRQRAPGKPSSIKQDSIGRITPTAV